MSIVKLKNAPARPDGRPMYYALTGEGDRVQCYCCLKGGVHSQYGKGEAVSSDPANPPPEERDTGAVYTLCVPHLPEDAVIYDPATDVCSNKSGKLTWVEQ